MFSAWQCLWSHVQHFSLVYVIYSLIEIILGIFKTQYLNSLNFHSRNLNIRPCGFFFVNDLHSYVICVFIHLTTRNIYMLMVKSRHQLKQTLYHTVHSADNTSLLALEVRPCDLYFTAFNEAANYTGEVMHA